MQAALLSLESKNVSYSVDLYLIGENNNLIDCVVHSHDPTGIAVETDTNRLFCVPWTSIECMEISISPKGKES